MEETDSFEVMTKHVGIWESELYKSPLFPNPVPPIPWMVKPFFGSPSMYGDKEEAPALSGDKNSINLE